VTMSALAQRYHRGLFCFKRRLTAQRKMFFGIREGVSLVHITSLVAHKNATDLTLRTETAGPRRVVSNPCTAQRAFRCALPILS
jgi:hypothetical protein